jgi:tripartite-type tricarboxylate transporter receptor subunit TctC
MNRITRRTAITGLVTGALSTTARAQETDWPKRPVRVILPFAPGAVTDIIVRGLAERLSTQTGQQFVVEHKGGAAGALGVETVAKAPKDGYTILMTSQGPLQVLPHLRKLSYDPLNDFVPVGRLGEQTVALVAHPSVGARDLREFIALAKANPGKFSYATAGVGSVNHLRGESLKMMAGIDLLHVPYRGVGEALPDLLAGHVKVMFDSNVLAHAKTGQLTVLGLLADTRHPAMPEVATMKEQGLPDYDVPAWFGVFAPVGLPTQIYEKLRAEVSTIHSDAAFHARQLASGILIYPEIYNLEQLRAKYEEQYRYFGDIIKRANIRLE